MMDIFHTQTSLGEIGNKMSQQSKNESIKQTLDIWTKMVKGYNMEEDTKLLVWSTLDPTFKPGSSDTGFRFWWDRGTTAMCTLTHKGLFKSFSELQNELGLEKKKDFFR